MPQSEKGAYGATSFSELDAIADAERKYWDSRRLAEQFLDIANNILADPDISDKAMAITSLAGEFASRIQAANKEQAILKAIWTDDYIADLPDSAFLHSRHLPYKDKDGKISPQHLHMAIADLSSPDQIVDEWLTETLRKELLAKAHDLAKDLDKPGIWQSIKDKIRKPDAGNDGPFSIWKSADGVTHWMAVFSNNYRDNDHPPEILSEAAHLDFVKAVDDGSWPLPELWIWHQKGTRWGEATAIVYESGFTVAVGNIDPGKEHIAQALAKYKGLGVSHGMPSSTIKRDPTDPTIITAYRSREISPLPIESAANKATGFSILKEEQAQMIPEHKKQFLAELGIDTDALQGTLTQAKDELDAAGVESKEEAPTEEVKEAPALDLAELASIIKEAISAAVAPLKAEIETLKEANEKQAADLEKAQLTPAQSMIDMLSKSAIGAKETKVDGRSTEAKDTPKETDPGPENLKGVGIPVIDAMRSGQDWRSAFANHQ